MASWLAGKADTFLNLALMYAVVAIFVPFELTAGVGACAYAPLVRLYPTFRSALAVEDASFLYVPKYNEVLPLVSKHPSITPKRVADHVEEFVLSLNRKAQYCDEEGLVPLVIVLLTKFTPPFEFIVPSNVLVSAMVSSPERCTILLSFGMLFCTVDNSVFVAYVVVIVLPLASAVALAAVQVLAKYVLAILLPDASAVALAAVPVVDNLPERAE